MVADAHSVIHGLHAQKVRRVGNVLELGCTKEAPLPAPEFRSPNLPSLGKRLPTPSDNWPTTSHNQSMTSNRKSEVREPIRCKNTAAINCSACNLVVARVCFERNPLP